MSAHFTVTIPEPCHESWAAMTPAAQGRHCAACDKKVVDFTRLTDAEVVAFLSQPTGPACGRFRAEQLSRPLRASAEAPASRRWLAAALALLGLGVAGPAGAQTKSTAPQEQRQLLGEARVPAATTSDRIIRGRVTDAGSSEGLPGVTVLLKGTTIGVSTNSDGSFELALPPSYNTYNQVDLMITSIGFTAQTYSMNLADLQPLAIELSLDQTIQSGEVVVVAGGVQAWYPVYSPRGLWQRLTQPFRHH